MVHSRRLLVPYPLECGVGASFLLLPDRGIPPIGAHSRAHSRIPSARRGMDAKKRTAVRAYRREAVAGPK